MSDGGSFYIDRREEQKDAAAAAAAGRKSSIAKTSPLVSAGAGRSANRKTSSTKSKAPDITLGRLTVRALRILCKVGR